MLKKVTDSIIYVGANDHEVDLFEGQYVVPNGMAYNSYVVMDEKIAVFDTVDAHFTDEWLANMAEVLGDRTPDYLIVQHMEPDHSANITNFAAKYPEAKIVANAMTFNMMKQFFGTDFADRRLVVKDGETLSSGKHTFTFVFAFTFSPSLTDRDCRITGSFMPHGSLLYTELVISCQDLFCLLSELFRRIFR